ncbi:hypothetical protein HK097_005531, partial [Rhizophlyctis rosea]
MTDSSLERGIPGSFPPNRDDLVETADSLPPALATEETPLLAAIAQTIAKPARLTYLDDLRGLLMILQSIDHARMFLSRIVIPHENWYEMPDYKGNLYHLLVRFVT